MFNNDKASWHHRLNLYTVYKSFLGVKIKCGNFHVIWGGKTARGQHLDFGGMELIQWIGLSCE